MSGIVRGWTDEGELDDINTCYTKVYGNHLDRPDDYIPVAVVPLDDATLAGCVERMLGVDSDSDVCRCEMCKRDALKELRAALGLGGGGVTVVMDDVKAMFELGVALGELNARMRQLREERDEARAVIAKAESMVNGYIDNDYHIAVEVLRPYLAKYATEPRG